MPGPGGRSVAWPVALIVVVVVNTIVMWSDAVGSWWSEQASDDGESILPGFVTDILSGRPDLGDADLHVLAWAVAGFVAVTAAGQWSRSVSKSRSRSTSMSMRIATSWIVTVWAWSVAVEVLQPVVSDTRRFDWIDLVANTLGVVLGASLATWWRWRRSREEDEGPWPDRDTDVTMDPAPRPTGRTR
jgi:hypothetical protein